MCRGLRQGEEESYLEFARKAWGPGSPQAQRTRLDWLYISNPNTRGAEKDLLLMLDNSVIVGAHHRMRIPWSIDGQRVIVPSFHDLFMSAAHRHGEGLQLVLAALSGESSAGLFGLSGIADQIYERMRVPTVHLVWLYKWRKRIIGALQHSTYRFGLKLPQFSYSPQTEQREVEGLTVFQTDSPTPQCIDEALEVKPSAAIYPDWDNASYSWRFFHPKGPKNLMLIVRRAGTAVGRAVISLGARRGIATARIVEFLAQDASSQAALVDTIEHTLSKIGVPFSAAVTNSPEVAQLLLQLGWKRRKEPPGARWFSRKRVFNPKEIFVSGGAWDFGCDVNLEPR